MDIHDPDCIAFQYLAYLHDVGRAPVKSVGWDLGLSNNEIKDVAQYLRSLGMVDLWSGSRGWRMSDILTLSASVSDSGKQHVRSIRETTSESEP